jgi:stearoyl-CoA desaturase (delta-9 desaturase)
MNQCARSQPFAPHSGLEKIPSSLWLSSLNCPSTPLSPAPPPPLHPSSVSCPLAPELETDLVPFDVEAPVFDKDGISFSKQYDQMMTEPLNAKRTVPKPSKVKQAQEPGAKPIFLSDVYVVPKRRIFFGREWNAKDISYAAFIGGMHLLALAAPATFSWPMVALFFGSYFVTGCLGITLGFHRMLAHRSFSVPKWLEHIFAYCGVLAMQGDPAEWASTHRYHHKHCDTPLDPHSTYEGFWWAHFGWLLDSNATLARVDDRSNVADLMKDPFYAHLQKHYALHVVGQLLALYLIGGLPAVVWGGALRAVWVYHVTWFVNSATHCWGYQTYDCGDLSKNNWWVGILAWGEGWHNTHHSFEFSARHGLEWWEVDVTWGVIWALEKLGLACNVKLPSETQLNRLRIKPEQAAA